MLNSIRPSSLRPRILPSDLTKRRDDIVVADMVADMEVDMVTDKVADMVQKCFWPKLFDAKCTRLACHFRSKKYSARFCAFFPDDFENRAGRQPLFGKTQKNHSNLLADASLICECDKDVEKCPDLVHSLCVG